MKVFAVYSEPLAGIVKVWSQSWKARGWKPQLLAPDEVAEHGSARAAARERGGGFRADLRVINFSLRPGAKGGKLAVCQGAPGWLNSPLVSFPESVTDQAIRECGRSI